MDFPKLIPAARYLRMSTERQHYSLANQSEHIQKYAEINGYLIVQTYSDEAKTGVLFRKRKGLQQLIHDVVQGQTAYKVILVYDVSRWGRSQDIDEAAYYEFLCKSAGIPVHYCAEPFSNEGGLSNLIMKSLKRVMAGEYSRELGVKVFAAQKRLAQLGYRQGGQPGYGLRRLLVSADGTHKQVLADGERKSIASDRVIQVPGPPEEVNCVREIYRLFIEEHLPFLTIAHKLNYQEMKYLYGKEWDHRSVRKILTHPKYAGLNVYGRTSMRLYTPTIKIPKAEWTVLPGAFEALVDPATFAEAQRLIAARTRNKTDEMLLDILRDIWAKKGKITIKLMQSMSGIPAVTTYVSHFGSITRAYELIGYQGYFSADWPKQLRNIRLLRENLLKELVVLSKGLASIEDRGPSYRKRLRLKSGRLISVIASRHYMSSKYRRKWRVKSNRGEYRLITLVALVSLKNDSFTHFFVTPPLRTLAQIAWSEASAQKHHAIRLSSIQDFFGVVKRITKSGRRH